MGTSGRITPSMSQLNAARSMAQAAQNQANQTRDLLATLPPTEVDRRISEILAKVETSNQAIKDLVGGVAPEDLNQIFEIANKVLEGNTKTAAMVQQISEARTVAENALILAQQANARAMTPGPKGDKGDTPTNQQLTTLIASLIPAPIKGDPGINATTTDIATPSTNGLMSAAQVTALNTAVDTLSKRPRVIYPDGIPGVVLNAGTAAEQFFTSNVAIPAGLIIPNRFFRLTVNFLVTSVAAPPVMVFRIRTGATQVLSSIASGTGSVTPAASRANQLFTLEALLNGGASSTIYAQGGIYVGSTFVKYPMTNPLPISINTSIENLFQLSVQYATAAGTAHTIQRMQVLLEALN